MLLLVGTCKSVCARTLSGHVSQIVTGFETLPHIRPLAPSFASCTDCLLSTCHLPYVPHSHLPSGILKGGRHQTWCVLGGLDRHYNHQRFYLKTIKHLISGHKWKYLSENSDTVAYLWFFPTQEFPCIWVYWREIINTHQCLNSTSG